MKNVIMAAAVLFVISVIAQSGERASAQGRPGEALFKQNCASCHANGGNIINPQKTLHKKSREANNIKTADDIVNVMRNPGPGMTKFDEKAIPDKDARLIADYILKTFK